MPDPVQLTVNGAPRRLDVDAARSLLSVLRAECELTGAKFGCGEGACGACSVLVDGAVTHACVTPVGSVAGRSIETVEGLARDGHLHPVQQAFVEEGALQCGYCTPGMVVAAVALLERDPDPDDDAIRAWMQPNICRCGAYPRIMRAVRRAAALARDHTVVRIPVGAAVEPSTRLQPRSPWDLTDPDERDYLAVLGDGLVAVAPPPDPPVGTGGAWVHVDPDGDVRAFIGKVEVGQGTRRALQLVVAGILEVPATRVEIVMGDTDVCPFDIGTFGSRSMPTALPDLRVATRAARRELRGLGIDAHASASEFGRVLAGMQRVVHACDDDRAAPDGEHASTLDHPAPRAVDAVTGAKRFATDVSVPGCWYGAIARPPTPGARLRRADVSRAAALANVVAVHDGDLVGVAAPDEATARRALQAVVTEWDDADLVGEAALVAHLRSHPIDVEGWNGAYEDGAGDVEHAFASAAVQHTCTYTAAYIAHAPMETRVALARWDAGRLTLWTATQQPFNTRRALAEAFGIAERDVRVVVPDAGGGFGGKHEPNVGIEAARLARACGRPVQVRWTREEEFTHAYFRPAAVIDVRVGATSDCDLVAWDFTNLNSGAPGIATPYNVANRRVRYQPAATPLRQGAYRALAATANHFARESAIDELAHALHVDPLEFRLRHMRDERLRAVLSAAADAFGWAGRPAEVGVGAGIAGGMEKGGRVATCVEVRTDGASGAIDIEIVRIVTAFECGAIVDPENLRNQIEGATVMGLGGACYEAIRFDRERILNPRFSEYRVPRFADIPPIDVVLVDRPDLPSAGGGETPIVAVAPALANAVFAATGERRRSLPLFAAR